MVKKTKSGEKEINIAPLIRKIRATYDPARPGALHVSAILAAGTSEHLNPEMLIQLARNELKILDENDPSQLYSILRTHVYLSDGVTEFR